MRKIVIAAALGAVASASTHAAVTPADEAVTRCLVDFELAYELTVPPPGPGETEAQALAKLSPDNRQLADAFSEMIGTARARIASWTHLTGDDSAKLAAVEKAEADEMLAMIDGAPDDAARNAAYDTLVDRVEACAPYFAES